MDINVSSIQNSTNLSIESAGTSGTSREYLRYVALCCGWTNVVLTVVGIFGNSLSIFIFSDRSQLNRRSRVELIGLSVVDLALLLCFVPLLIVPQMIFAYAGGPKFFYDMVFYAFAYVYPWALTFQTISVLLLVLITVERFFAVCYPIQTKVYCTPNWCRTAVLATFILGFLINLIRFWEYRVNPCPTCRSSTVMTEGILAKNPSYKFWYKLVMPAAGSLIACALITGLNGMIIRALWLARKQYTKMTRSVAVEHNITKMMVTVIFLFVLCYGLHFFMYFYKVTSSQEMGPELHMILLDISNTLVTVNPAITCFVYCMCDSYKNRARVLIGSGILNICHSPDPAYGVVAVDEGSTTVKESSLSRNTSLGRMNSRFGNAMMMKEMRGTSPLNIQETGF